MENKQSKEYLMEHINILKNTCDNLQKDRDEYINRFENEFLKNKILNDHIQLSNLFIQSLIQNTKLKENNKNDKR